MLPPALLTAADRLATTLMALVMGVGDIAIAGGTPSFPGHAAHTLFLRLAHLIRTLIRINNFGIRAPAKPATPNARPQPAPTAQPPSPAERLPSRPGWLLAALPDIAPAVAADLTALLADSALAALLAAAPTLHRTLRPLLRGLALASPDPPSTPPPQTPVRKVECPAPHPPTARPQSPTPRSPARPLQIA